LHQTGSSDRRDWDLSFFAAEPDTENARRKQETEEKRQYDEIDDLSPGLYNSRDK
jgi:hypothetical protein